MNNNLAIELIIIGIIAVAAVEIIRIFLSDKRNKENNYVNNIISDRFKSKEALRDLISKYCALCIVLKKDEEEKNKRYEELLEIQNKILLLLDPNEEADCKTAEQLKECIRAFEATDSDIEAEANNLIESSREMFCSIIEKAKKETVSSNIKKSGIPAINGKAARKFIPLEAAKYKKLLVAVNLILLGFAFFKSLGIPITLGVLFFFNGVVYFVFTVGEMFKIEVRE